MWIICLYLTARSDGDGTFTCKVMVTDFVCEDAIAMATHTALSHLEHQQCYGQHNHPGLLSQQTTPPGPSPLHVHLDKGLFDKLCVKLGPPHIPSHHSSSRLSPFLFHGVQPWVYTCPFIKQHYKICWQHNGDWANLRRRWIWGLLVCCLVNNLVLTTKTKELTLDNRRKHDSNPAPVCINWKRAQCVHSFKFLGVHVHVNLSWSAKTTATVKKDSTSRKHRLLAASTGGHYHSTLP